MFSTCADIGAAPGVQRAATMSGGVVVGVFWRWLLVVVVALLVVGSAHSKDPRSKSECVAMVRAPLQSQCRSMFSDPSQIDACLQQINPQLERVCEQFFGAQSDFCATCTASCNQAFQSGDGKRRECLGMCLRQPGCQ